MSIVSAHPLSGEARNVRAWLIDGGDPDGFVDGRPLWTWLMEKGTPEGTAEILAAGANPNRRTADGQGWLHWCVATHQPEWIAMAGLALLDDDWGAPDGTGRTPLHLGELPAGVGQALAARWWAEGRDWARLMAPESPEEAAVRAGNQPLARVWRGWTRAFRVG